MESARLGQTGSNRCFNFLPQGKNMSEEINAENQTNEVKPVLPEAPKPVLPEAPAAQAFPAPKAVVLPKANIKKPAFNAVGAKAAMPVVQKGDSPSALSVAVDFLAAAVAIAFAVLIVLDV